MSNSLTAGLSLKSLSAWINEIRALTEPKHVQICDGSKSEWNLLTTELVEVGTLIPLAKKQNSFWCAFNPSDVARVEDRTFICSTDHQGLFYNSYTFHTPA